MHIHDIVMPEDSILIVPAPSGYILMKAPTTEDAPLEMFAALTSAGDVILFLIDVYGCDIPESNEEKENLCDGGYGMMHIGRATTERAAPVEKVEVQRIEAEDETVKPSQIPEVVEDVAPKSGKKPLQIAQADKAKKPKPIAVATKNTHKSEHEKCGYMCDGCGETYKEQPPTCTKCGASAFDEVPVAVLQEMSTDSD